jgi:intein/homing endonuclease
MYLALIILPLLGSIASGLARSTPGFSSSTPSRDIRNKQRVPKKLLHSNANGKGYYYTGFFDAEGCFRVKIVRNKKYSTGWHIHPNFSIVAHKRDLYLLKQINEFLGGLGKIYVTCQ